MVGYSVIFMFLIFWLGARKQNIMESNQGVVLLLGTNARDFNPAKSVGLINLFNMSAISRLKL